VRAAHHVRRAATAPFRDSAWTTESGWFEEKVAEYGRIWAEVEISPYPAEQMRIRERREFLSADSERERTTCQWSPA
jgi:hypothetical protein